MSLALAPAAAQSDTVDEAAQVTSFHYWVDNVAQRQTVSPTDGRAAWDIDVSALAQGLHALYYQAEDSNGRLSAPRRKDFFVATPGKGATELVGCRYWVDNVKNLQETSLSEGSTALDIDVSQLSDGLHTLFLQMKDNKGRLSPARASYFHVVRAATDVVAVRYWIDSRTNVQRTEMSGGQAAWDIDVTALALGLHHLYYQAEDNLGQLSAPRVRHFFVSEAEQQPDNRIAAYEYWVGSGEPVRVTLDEPQQTTALEGLDIATGDQTLCRVPSDYTFLPDDGIATYWAAIPFGLRVYTVAGAVSETVGADSTQVVLHLEQTTLAYGDSVTTITPRGDGMRDFLGLGQQGDSIAITIRVDTPDEEATTTYAPMRLDLYDAHGVRHEQSLSIPYGTTTSVSLTLPNDSAYMVVCPAENGLVAEVPMVVRLSKIDDTPTPEQPTYHQVSVIAEGEGMVVVNRTDTIYGTSSTLQIEEGARVELRFIAQPGNLLDQATMNDSVDLLSLLQDEAYVIDSLTTDVRIAARYVYEEVPPPLYSVEITASGTGAVVFEDRAVRNATYTDQWGADTTYTLHFLPDEGSHLASATLNGSIDMMPMIVYGEYTFQEMTSNISVVAVFEADSVPPTPTDYADFSLDGILFHVTDTLSWQVQAMSISDRQHLVVPQQVAQYGHEWTVAAVSGDAFEACTSLVSVQLPATVGSLPAQALAHNAMLAAIDWGADTPVPFEGLQNPNLLLYVKDPSLAPAGVQNVVVNGLCNRLVLTDATDATSAICHDFYALHPFTALSAHYTHTYTLPTPIDGSYGWETLTLPFDVQLIIHESRGTIAPFAALDEEGFSLRRPFWLCGPSATGFQRAAEVKAYVPYLIAMPNNPIYYPEYRLSGKVEFTARDVQVEATGEALAQSFNAGSHGFVPSYQHLDASPSLWVVNIGGEGNEVAGSAFVAGARDVQPFQAYLTTAAAGAPLLLPVKEMLDDGVTAIQSLSEQRSEEAATLYDLGGRKVDNDRMKDRSLRKGVYVSNGKKRVVK